MDPLGHHAIVRRHPGDAVAKVLEAFAGCCLALAGSCRDRGALSSVKTFSAGAVFDGMM